MALLNEFQSVGGPFFYEMLVCSSKKCSTIYVGKKTNGLAFAVMSSSLA